MNEDNEKEKIENLLKKNSRRYRKCFIGRIHIVF